MTDPDPLDDAFFEDADATQRPWSVPLGYLLLTVGGMLMLLAFSRRLHDVLVVAGLLTATGGSLAAIGQRDRRVLATSCALLAVGGATYPFVKSVGAFTLVGGLVAFHVSHVVSRAVPVASRVVSGATLVVTFMLLARTSTLHRPMALITGVAASAWFVVVLPPRRE